MAEAPPEVYPRPDFERRALNWESLNGQWHFAFDDNDSGFDECWYSNGLPDEKSREIKVPFVFQSRASGVNEQGVHEVLWYERTVKDIRTQESYERGDRLLLRFGAVDYQTIVWVEDKLVGSHRGGHVPFDIDITDALPRHQKSSANVVVRVFDSAYDLAQPRGKQYWKPQPESIFYTPSSGIWQSVWVEAVPRLRLADASHGTVIRSNDITSGNLRCRVAVLGRRAGEPCKVELEASFHGVSVSSTERHDLPQEKDYVQFDLNLRLSPQLIKELPTDFLDAHPLSNDRCWQNGLPLWAPEHPLLYDLTLLLYDQAGVLLDEVKMTTGMRSLNWQLGNGTIELNNKPYFQSLVLDQGYWPDTLMTPPDSESCKRDIELSKELGFNGCRKHQKVEDPLFLYWADRLGYLVWSEMANAYEFDQTYTERFNQEWLEAVKRDINHPCVVTWTPVNESWAYDNLNHDIEQRNHIRSLYYMTKALDPTRSINDNCGWEHVMTDLTTFHDYSDAPQLADTCSTLEGILKPKGGRELFVLDIEAHGSVKDKGSHHQPGAPVLCTEFGGVNIKPAETNGESDPSDRKAAWGYTTASDPNDLLHRFERLVMAVVEGGHCCGLVYTQLTDIEQETNGLCAFDRQPKLDPKRTKAILDRAQEIYYERQTQSNQSFMDMI